MKCEIISIVKSEMLNCLNAQQLDRLGKVLEHVLWDVTISKEDKKSVQATLTNEILLSCFLEAKQLEGCSPKTLKYYRGTINNMFSHINKSTFAIETEDIRK